MDIKFNMNVERYGNGGELESTLFSLPLRGTPMAEFNITAPQKDGRGRAQVTRYIIFNQSDDPFTEAFNLLALGEDHGVPVFSYRYAMDAAHLAEHLSADGLNEKHLKEIGEKLGVNLPHVSVAVEQDVSDVLYKMMDVRETKQNRRIPVLLRPARKNIP